MVSVAEKKFDYRKAHWLDIVIILLPVITGSLARPVAWLQQLSRTPRAGHGDARGGPCWSSTSSAVC
jgi:hypothetical protein